MTKSKFHQLLKVFILILLGAFYFYGMPAKASSFTEGLNDALLENDQVSRSCYTDSNGKQKCIATTDGGKAVVGVMRGCKPMPTRLAELSDTKDCLLCGMFKVILNTDQAMATMSYGALAKSFRRVIIIVLALFIAYHTLLTVSAVTKQDVGKYLQTIIIQAFKVLVAALFLTSATYVYTYIVNPLMAAGLDFGLSIIDDGVLVRLDALAKESEGVIRSGVISQNLLAKVLGTIILFSTEAAKLPTIGSALICVSVHAASPGLGLPDFSMFLEGLISYAFGWCIALACCFYLLDSVVRFGIFCTLLPFLIACWPFKVTAKYTKAGWDIFMNTFFNFVMMGLVLSLTQKLILEAMKGDSGEDVEIEDLLNGNDVDKLKEVMSLDGAKFLILIACCIFAFKLVGQVGELANQVSSTSGPTSKNSIGGHLGGLAAQGAKKVATAGAKAAGKITGASGAIAGVKDKLAAKNDGIRNKLNGTGAGGGSDGGGSGGDTSS